MADGQRFSSDAEGLMAVLRRLRASDDTKSIPVIILSALNSNDDVAKGISMGAEDYITKPIIMDRLQSSVIKQLNKLFE